MLQVTGCRKCRLRVPQELLLLRQRRVERLLPVLLLLLLLLLLLQLLLLQLLLILLLLLLQLLLLLLLPPKYKRCGSSTHTGRSRNNASSGVSLGMNTVTAVVATAPWRTAARLLIEPQPIVVHHP
jgi:hypothetical protein